MDVILGHRTIAVEVAEDGTRFAADEAPVFEDGLPAYGAAFVTQGYLYPVGTLAGSEHGGVMPDGSPEFPDDVIGEWTCWGYHVGDGANTESGPWVVSTQLFSFGENDGQVTIVTHGYEMTANDASQGPFNRAITGGTGSYRTARGEQTQTFLGWNDSIGVQLSVQLRTK
jgi:hypothetical protein